MKRKAYGRDTGLTLRLLFTGGLLGLVYVVFAAILISFIGGSFIVGLVIVAALAVFQYFSSAKLALLASGAKIVERDQAPALHDMIERLCAMADLPKPKVAIIDTPVPNAFATGRNPKHAAVAVTTGLWETLEPQEIEGVLAHELSHIGNRDVLIMTLASFFALLAGLITRFAMYARDLRRRPPRQQRPAGLADRPARLGDHLRAQLHPHPRHLPLPRVRGRPGLGADHGRARAPDERAPEDLRQHRADPASATCARWRR